MKARGYLDTNLARDFHALPPPLGRLRPVTVGPILGGPHGWRDVGEKQNLTLNMVH
jgi:hypothetical protein